jgi:hypothetical protein
MAKFKSNIRSEKSPDEMNRIITNYLTAKGYAPKEKNQRSQWQKGVYWTKYLMFTFAPGGVVIDAWINVPLAGFGSYIKYFSGKKELQVILKELETFLGNSGTGGENEWLTKPVPSMNAAGSTAALPDELNKWSWAAFLWGPVWAIGHGVWIGLLTLIPYVGFVMIFVMGAKGNQWAWEKNKYDSWEQFAAKQKTWLKAWFLIVGALFALAIFIPLFVRNR